MPKKIVDFEFLRENTFGNTAYLLELLELFMVTTTPLLNDLKKHCQAQQWLELRQAAHKLKSNYSLLGVKEGEKILKRLEYYDGNAAENQATCVSLDRLVELTEVVYKELTLEMELLKK